MASNNIYIQVDFNSQAAQQNVNALNNAIQSTGPTAQKSAAQTTSAMTSINLAIKQTAGAFTELTGALAGLGIGKIVTSLVQMGSELNRSQRMMESFTGSAEEARKVFEQIRAIAAEGPFRFKDLEETGQRLLAFGMAAKDVPNTLKIITDQVAATGGSIENVNSIITIFGRIMNKEMVGAMDLMRLLPAQAVPIGEALQKALGVKTTEEATKALKAGAVNYQEVIKLILQTMQQHTAGAGGRINDAAKSFKNLGDEINDAKKELIGPNGFGPAINNLAHEVEQLLAPVAGLVVELQKLDPQTKQTIVNIAAATAAFAALSIALQLIGPLVKPAIVAIGLLGKALLFAFTNPALLAAMAGIAATIGAIWYFKPEWIEKFKKTAGDAISGLWDKVKDKLAALSKEGQAFIKKIFTGEDVKAGDIKQETDENLKIVRDQVEAWADGANKVLLQALSSPAEAVRVKYEELFAKLKKLTEEHYITPEHAEQFMQQLSAARMIETESKLFEKRKQDIAENAKIQEEKVKGSYDAQIAYIEAMDAQDLRGKVAANDKITELRIQSVDEVAKVQKKALQDNLDAMVLLFNANREMLEKSGVDVDQAIKDRTAETLKKMGLVTQKAEDDAQKYRLEGWKRTNDLIIEDQRRVFEGFKSIFDEIFDAFTDRTKSIGQALGDMFKKLALGEAREMFSSQLAAGATEMAGYGRPTEQLARGSGFLASLFQRGMAPRPPMAPPAEYAPGKSDEVIKTLTPALETSVVKPLAVWSDIYATSTDQYSTATVTFANAVDKFAGASGQSATSVHLVSGTAGTSGLGDAFEQASIQTGVPTSVLRGVAKVESSFRAGAVSSKGAQGVMQLMPSTSAYYGVTDPFNASQNIMGGAKYLEHLTSKYGGDREKIFAAYAMGEPRLDRLIARGLPIPKDVLGYVGKVQAAVAAQGGESVPPALFELPEGFSRGPGGEVSYTPPAMAAVTQPELPAPPSLSYDQLGLASRPEMATMAALGGTAGAGAVTTAPMPAEVAMQKQGGVGLGSALGVIGAASGMGGGGGTQKTIMGMLLGDPKKLLETFGIGVKGGTSLSSVLHSPGIANLALMGGMSLMAAGIQHRSTAMQVAGGALLGPKIAQMIPGIGLWGGLGAGAGIGLFSAGVQKGGVGGMFMDIGGGALTGLSIGSKFGPMGMLIGAGIGAAVGAITGAIRMVVKTESERIRAQIKQVYGIDISDLKIIAQIKQIVDQKYGGSVSVGVRSQEVQELVRLYALSTGQSTMNMPRPMYSATIAQSNQGMQLQPTYSGGVQVQNPYTGTTTYQYQTAVAAAQGMMPGTSQGVPGASGLITQQWQQLAVQTIQNNPSAIGMASAAAARAGDSRLTTTAAMQEPLTALS